MTCTCGHEQDEHDDKQACTVEDCPCFYYEGDPDA